MITSRDDCVLLEGELAALRQHAARTASRLRVGDAELLGLQAELRRLDPPVGQAMRLLVTALTLAALVFLAAWPILGGR